MEGLWKELLPATETVFGTVSGLLSENECAAIHGQVH